ncbi:hypothetical protein COBT_000938 [Conglomerata obtusa]
MKNFDFKNILSTFESKRSSCNYEVKEKPVNELAIIKQDVDRSFHFLTGKSLEHKEKYKRILYEVLISIPIDYIQSMSDVASIIVYYYFRNEIDEETENDDEITICHDLLEVTKISVTNILKEKVEPLLNEEFSLYLKYNRTFIKMMENRGRKIGSDESIKYMNNTLTWFCMLFTKVEDIYTIAGFILACPTSFYFLILIKFFDDVEKKRKVKNLEANLYEQLLALEKEFLNTENEMKVEQVSLVKPRDVIIAGSLVAIAGAILYGFYTRDK